VTRQKLYYGDSVGRDINDVVMIILSKTWIIHSVYVKFDICFICFDNTGSVSAFREPYITSRRRLCARHIAIGFEAAVLAAHSERMLECLHKSIHA
jgi:hypothetical protein